MKSDENILENWLREPDHAENFTLEDMARWLNARPLAEFYRMKAELARSRAEPRILNSNMKSFM